MPDQNDHTPVNPYDPPRGSSMRNTTQRDREHWVGPLLMTSVCLFMSAFFGSAATVMEQDRWLLDTIVASLALAGTVCLSLSFRLHRRAIRK